MEGAFFGEERRNLMAHFQNEMTIFIWLKFIFRFPIIRSKILMAHHLLAFTTFAFKNQKPKWKVIITTDHPNGKHINYIKKTPCSQ